MESSESLAVDILQNHQIHISDRDGSILLAEHGQLFLFSIYKHQTRTKEKTKLIDKIKETQDITEKFIARTSNEIIIACLQCMTFFSEALIHLHPLSSSSLL